MFDLVSYCSGDDRDRSLSFHYNISVVVTAARIGSRGEVALGKRRRSREIALQVLYQIDLSGGSAEEVLGLFWQHFSPPDELKDFSECIVNGVGHHREEIDAIIEYYSEHWRLKRMSLVDRNILRTAIFELLYCADTPTKVIINEAVDLGKKFGSGKSGSFVNGILDRIAHFIERLQPAGPN